MAVDEYTQTETERKQERRAALIRGLHEVADWLEAHPDVPVNAFETSPAVALYASAPFRDPKAWIAAAARAMGRADKVADETHFNLRRDFGDGTVRFEAYAAREAVCERVVVGSREEEVPDPEAVAKLPTVKQTRVEEEVEWRCPDALLAKP